MTIQRPNYESTFVLNRLWFLNIFISQFLVFINSHENSITFLHWNGYVVSSLTDSFFVEKCFAVCAEKISFYIAEAINNNHALITFLFDFLRTIITINKQLFRELCKINIIIIFMKIEWGILFELASMRDDII